MPAACLRSVRPPLNVGIICLKQFRGLLLLLSIGAYSACSDLPDRAPLTMRQLGDTLQIAGPLSAIAPELRLKPVSVLRDLVFPTDVAELDAGSIAVLDRLDLSVVVLDPTGVEIRRIGREGEGPGEFSAPYALAATAGRLAVLDLNRRLTIFNSEGSVLATVPDVGGDARTVWQRFPLSQWEEPLQMSREDVSRRLGPLDSGAFGLLLQDRDERFDAAFVEAGTARRFPHNLIRVGPSAETFDTVATLEGSELRLVHAGTAQSFSLAGERPFALRPLWSSGEGWIALGHGADSIVSIHLDDGRNLSLAWPFDSRPLGAGDFNSYIDWEIEAYRRTSGEVDADQVAGLDRDEWIAKELGHWTERPQISGLLGAGPCLVLLPFRPDDGPLGESSTVVIVPLTDPARSTAIRLESRLPGFLRHLGTESAFRIAVADDGTRVIERFTLPQGLCN